MSETTARTPRRIVVIGGGNGASTILRGLAEAGLAPNMAITAAITGFDDGNSTGRLRETDPSLQAPGDIRRALAALATDRQAAAEFNRRLEDGHAVGNLVLAQLNRELGSFDLAIAAAAEKLRVRGRVFPVSRQPATLVLDHKGERVTGEHNIGNFPIVDPWARVSLKPPVGIHPEVEQAISDADAVIIAPGSVFTSLGAALAPQGMPEALQTSKGRLIAVANLEPEQGQIPYGWRVADHVLALEDIIGRPFDDVLYHVGPLPDGTAPLSAEPSDFGAVSARCTGIPMATIRETDGRVVHDAGVVARALGDLLIS